MIQKVAVGILLVALFIGGNISYAHAQGLSVSQLIDLLISAGMISPDKAAAAKAAAGVSSAKGTPPACGLVRNLSLGSRGDDVKDLQAKLGIASPTGYFGEQTRAAVRAFQRANGLPATGEVGPLTRASWANKYPCDKKNESATTTGSSASTTAVSKQPVIADVKFYQGNALYSGPITLGSTYRVEWKEKDVTGPVTIWLVEQQSPNWVKELKLGTVASNNGSFTFDMPTTFQKDSTRYRVLVEGDGVSAYTSVFFEPAYQY